MVGGGHKYWWHYMYYYFLKYLMKINIHILMLTHYILNLLIIITIKNLLLSLGYRVNTFLKEL